jgi:hypothetical protein
MSGLRLPFLEDRSISVTADWLSCCSAGLALKPAELNGGRPCQQRGRGCRQTEDPLRAHHRSRALPRRREREDSKLGLREGGHTTLLWSRGLLFRLLGKGNRFPAAG